MSPEINFGAAVSMYAINQTRLIDTFMDLVRIPSPSWKEHRVMNYITRRLDRLGIGHRAVKCRDSFNLLATIKGGGRVPGILFSAHMDTVQPCEGVKPVLLKNKITSDGTTILGGDDKAAVAIFLEGLHCMVERNLPHGNIEILFSCAEELGLQGIKLFDFSLLKSKYAFVFDSDGDVGNIVVKAPYHSKLEITVHGKAVHAGMEPEKGVNAINVLSEIITAIPSGRIDSETTVNVGTVSGGTAINIVAEQAKCELEVRSIDRKKLARYEKIITETIKKTCAGRGAKPSITRTLLYSGFTVGEKDPVLRAAMKAMKAIKVEPRLRVSGGGSDTNIINAAGIRGINLACGMRNVHGTSEYVYIRDLMKGTKLMLSLISTMAP